MSYDPITQAFQTGANLWPTDLDVCPLAVGNTRTVDYGPGPFPGTRSTRFVLAGDNEGVNTGFLTLVGRTDGAMFGEAVWLKGSGTLELRMRAVGASSGVTETVGTLPVTLDSTWRRYVLRDYVAQFDCSTLIAEIRGTGAGATVEAYGADLRLLNDYTGFPEYQKPIGFAQRIFISCRLSTTVAAWSDSMWRTCSIPLAAILRGTKVYNGGVGGENSAEIRARFLATTDAAKLYRAYGVTVIWAGHNNYTGIDDGTLVGDLDAMIAALNHSRYLILGLAGGSGAAPGAGPYPYYCRAHQKYKQRYGTRFCDVVMPLHGGTAYTLDAVREDAIHLNKMGCDLVANEVAKSIKRNGWLEDVQGVFDFGESADQEETHHITLYSSVPAAVTTGNVILPMGKRHGFRIHNDTTTGVMLISFGTYASGSSFAVKLQPGASYEMIGGKYHGPLTAYWTVADGNARVTEFV